MDHQDRIMTAHRYPIQDIKWYGLRIYHALLRTVFVTHLMSNTAAFLILAAAIGIMPAR